MVGFLRQVPLLNFVLLESAIPGRSVTVSLT
jgi:hypothetical protein